MGHIVLLTQERVAEALGGISERTLERWRVEGRGPRFVRVGRLVRYRPEDIETFVNGRIATSTSDRGGEAA